MRAQKKGADGNMWIIVKNKKRHKTLAKKTNIIQKQKQAQTQKQKQKQKQKQTQKQTQKIITNI